MKKTIVSILLSMVTLFGCVGFTGCEIDLGENGKVQSELTKLSAPKNVRVENDLVRWSSVSNADSYIVQVGTEAAQATTTELAYPLSSLLSESATGLYVKVKALPSSSILYSESDWSEVYGPFDYTVSGNSSNQGGESDKENEEGGTFLQTGVGCSVDVVSADNYNDFKNGVSVLDKSKLRESSFEEIALHYNQDRTTESHSISNLVSKSSVSFEMNVGNNSKMRTMFCNISVGLESSSSFEYSKYSNKYYYILDHYIERYSLSLIDFAVEDKYVDYLTSDYLNALNTLYNDQSQIAFETFFKKYGTHIIGSAIFGGRLNAYFSAVTNKTTIDESMASNLSSTVSFGKSAVNNTSASVKTSISTALGVAQEDVQTSFSAVAYGGASFGASSIDDFNNNYNTWWSSFNDDQANAVLVNYSKDGLLALWDLLPNEYEGMAEAMEAAFAEYYAKEYDGFIEKFSYDDTANYAGGSGTKSDPYLIANEEHLKHIDLNPASCFKLTNDIDLTKNTWVAIDEFSGELDGAGYKIDGLHTSKDLAGKGEDYGLFRQIKNAKIYDLNFENVLLKVDNDGNCSGKDFRVGTIAGYAENCTITKISVSGKVSLDGSDGGGAIIGGLFGEVKSCDISYCKNSADIWAAKGYACAGGIAGWCRGTYENTSKFSYNENVGDIGANGNQGWGYAYACGIVGKRQDSNCIIDETNSNNGELTAKGAIFATCDKDDLYVK
ncbi:MAG: hypothetical protein IJ506_05005 [Clostridia bacterium]|nr:hypothetical protein [Clostridia bacterium]